MSNILALFKPVRVLVFDVDGVMTDGTLLITDQGRQQRIMHIRDGYALQLASKKGYRVAALSGARSAGVARRLTRLGLRTVAMEVPDKGAWLATWMEQEKIDPATLLYMGDDIPDLPALRLAGLAACPRDAAEEIRAVCQYISPFPGGAGCVRDVLEKVLKLNGHWAEPV